jgi:hypothetical protein
MNIITSPSSKNVNKNQWQGDLIKEIIFKRSDGSNNNELHWMVMDGLCDRDVCKAASAFSNKMDAVFEGGCCMAVSKSMNRIRDICMDSLPSSSYVIVVPESII